MKEFYDCYQSLGGKLDHMKDCARRKVNEEAGVEPKSVLFVKMDKSMKRLIVCLNAIIKFKIITHNNINKNLLLLVLHIVYSSLILVI